ncbi:MAG TPA: cytochrome c biogenesis protein CcsA [Terriglobia bacterium]|nr:cytochrome c biogenesis protein CcsA [Terriglobia bacterium]
MYTGFITCALALYALGILLILPSVARRRAGLPAAALGALALGLVMHGAALAVLAARVHRLPIIDVRSALSFLAFDLTLAFFLIYLRQRIPSLGIFMLPFVFVLTLAAAVEPGHSFDSAQFRSGWLLAHIASMILGYTGFFITFVAAVMYLIQESELKRKQPRAFYYRLPSLEVCDSLYYRSLVFGLVFLSAGLITGFVSASREWRGPWEYDPKILASLGTWVIYLTLFSTRWAGNWRGRRSAYVAILGFAAILVTFLGASFLSGQHGFFPNLGGTP